MTSISDVESVWTSTVFGHSSITSITQNAIPFEYTEDSQFEIEGLYKDNADGLGEINFFEYQVLRAEEVVECGGAAHPEYEFTVDVRYTRTQDTIGQAESEVKTAIQTLCDTVRTQMGTTWSTLEVRTELKIAPGPLQRVVVNQTPCIRQAVSFRGYKF